MPGPWFHLGRRFFDSLNPHDLEAVEVDEVRQMLSDREFDLFIAQPIIDMRHGYESARHVRLLTDDGDIVRAAAMHDVAKRHAGLGIFGRVFASIAIKLHLPLNGRHRIYRDHGLLASVELQAIGSPTVAVDFARSHHGTRPTGIAHATWRLLSDADRAPQRSQSVRMDR